MKQCEFCVSRIMLKFKSTGKGAVPMGTRRVRITENKRIRYPLVCEAHHKPVRQTRHGR